MNDATKNILLEIKNRLNRLQIEVVEIRYQLRDINGESS